MKNAFYFILKALFIFKIFKLLSLFFGCVEKWLNWKDKLNFEIGDVTAWITIPIQILLNITQVKSNHAIKFGQLIEYRKVNILLQKSCQK